MHTHEHIAVLLESRIDINGLSCVADNFIVVAVLALTFLTFAYVDSNMVFSLWLCIYEWQANTLQLRGLFN